MKISVIIPCYNAADTVGDQIQAILAQETEFPFEVIVVNNNSTDRSKEVVSSFVDRSPQIKLVDALEKQGPGYTRNMGARVASGDVFVFCDADDLVTDGWLQTLVSGLEEGDLAIGRISHKKLNKHSWLEAFDIDSDDYQDEDIKEEDHRASFPPYLMMVRGWGFAIKRPVFEQVGGFDEELMAAEDLDFGFKAQLAGAKVKFLPDALLHYRMRSTPEAMKKQWYAYGFYTSLMMKKYSSSRVNQEYFRKWGNHLLGWIQLCVWRIRIKEKWEVGLFTRNLAYRHGMLRGSIKFRVPPQE